MLFKDSNGQSEIVALCMIASEDATSIRWMLNTFKTHHEKWSDVCAVMADKDIKECDIVKDCFQTRLFWYAFFTYFVLLSLHTLHLRLNIKSCMIAFSLVAPKLLLNIITRIGTLSRINGKLLVSDKLYQFFVWIFWNIFCYITDIEDWKRSQSCTFQRQVFLNQKDSAEMQYSKLLTSYASCFVN